MHSLATTTVLTHLDYNKREVSVTLYLSLVSVTRAPTVGNFIEFMKHKIVGKQEFGVVITAEIFEQVKLKSSLTVWLPKGNKRDQLKEVGKQYFEKMKEPLKVKLQEYYDQTFTTF